MTAPWYMLVIQAIALMGFMWFITATIFSAIGHVVRWISKPAINVFMSKREIYMNERDPTRPPLWEDESAAWINVTRRMEQFQTRARIEKGKS